MCQWMKSNEHADEYEAANGCEIMIIMMGTEAVKDSR